MQPMGLDSQMGQAGHVRPAWRMTGSVRMFWMFGSAMAFSRRCASSSSDTSPLLICRRIGGLSTLSYASVKQGTYLVGIKPLQPFRLGESQISETSAVLETRGTLSGKAFMSRVSQLRPLYAARV